MTDGFDEARRQRNWLERLGEKIPGFRGYQDRELRRDVDRRQRAHLARRLGEIKTATRTLARDYTDAGRIGDLFLFERLDRRLDGLAQSIRFADYGFSGLFDVEKIDEGALERLYEFDLTLVEDLDEIAAAVEALPRPGDGGLAAAADRVMELAEALRGKWARREGVISNVVER